MSSNLELLEQFKKGTLIDHSPDISTFQEMKTNNMANHSFRRMATTFEQMIMQNKPDNVVYALVEYVNKDNIIDLNKVKMHEVAGYRVVPPARHYNITDNNISLSQALEDQTRSRSYHEGISTNDLSKMCIIYHNCILMEINKDLYDYQAQENANVFNDIYNTNGPNGKKHRDYGMKYTVDSDITGFDQLVSNSPK